MVVVMLPCNWVTAPKRRNNKKKGVNLNIFICINMFVQKIYLTEQNNHQTTPNVISGLRCFFLFSQTLLLTFYVIIGFFFTYGAKLCIKNDNRRIFPSFLICDSSLRGRSEAKVPPRRYGSTRRCLYRS